MKPPTKTLKGVAPVLKKDEPEYGILIKGKFVAFPRDKKALGRAPACKLCPYQLACFEGHGDSNAPLYDMPIDEDT